MKVGLKLHELPQTNLDISCRNGLQLPQRDVCVLKSVKQLSVEILPKSARKTLRSDEQSAL
jgi:hypothetical protein